MVKTTTYSRRHRLKNKENHQPNIDFFAKFERYKTFNPNDEVADSLPKPLTRPSSTGSRKRSAGTSLDNNKSENNPHKKRKLSKEATSTRMSLQPFQTPYPTLQAQSQIFRLPSSKPQPSPEELVGGLLSATAIPAANVSKARVAQIHEPGNASQITETLKSSRTHSDSTKAFSRSSVTLTSNAYLSSKDDHISSRLHDRGSGFGARSPSCSSSNSNASRSSRRKSRLKHTQSLSSLKPEAKKTKKKQKSGKGRAANLKLISSRTLGSDCLSDESSLALASPFVSRASSPVGDEDIIVDQKRKQLMRPPLVLQDTKSISSGRHGRDRRTALSDISYHPNLPCSASKSRSTNASPQKRNPVKVDLLKLKMKTKSSTKVENRVPQQGILSNERERRPSAPSWVHPPRPKKRFSEQRLGRDEKRKLQLSSDLNILLDFEKDAPKQAVSGDVPRNTHEKVTLQNPDDALEWMHSRRDVNFDRAPSRMSIGGSGFGYDAGFEYGEVEGTDVFLPSEEGEASEDEHAQVARPGTRKFQRIRDDAADKAGHWRKLPLGLDAAGSEVFGAQFGKDVLVESTPLKLSIGHLNSKIRKKKSIGCEMDFNVVERKRSSALTRTFSLPNFGAAVKLGFISSSSQTAAQGAPSDSSSYIHHGAGQVKEIMRPTSPKDRSDGQDGEVDMELTVNANSTAMMVLNLPLSGVGRLSVADEEVSGQIDADLTPWVTDSIISPPTMYVDRKKKTNDVQMRSDEKMDNDFGLKWGREREHLFSSIPPPMRLSSPFRPSDGSAGTEYNSGFQVLPDTEGLDDPERHLDRYSEVTSDSSNKTGSPAILQDNDKPILENVITTRTRSGTIVPAAAPPGTRRTRGGTIIGPLPPAPAPAQPLPPVPSVTESAISKGGIGFKTSSGLPTRTRSGTIVASNGSGTGPSGGGRRTGSASASHVKGNGGHFSNALVVSSVATSEKAMIENNLMDAQTLENEEQDEGSISDVDCYVDSLYLPPLVSSPDPIDFLRFANIIEEDEDCGPDGMRWIVAGDPPSPEIYKNRKGDGGSLFARGRLGSLRRKFGAKGGDVKGKGKKNARFVGREGEEEEQAKFSDQGELGDEELSEDELLLKPGSTRSLWV